MEDKRYLKDGINPNISSYLMWFLYSGILFMLKKEGNSGTYCNMMTLQTQSVVEISLSQKEKH